MLTLALVILQLAVGVDLAPEGAPYTDPVGLCIPRMAALQVEDAREQEGDERPPTCDDTWAASDPRCRLRTPPPPLERTHEQMRSKPVACIAQMSLPPRLPQLFGRGDDSAGERDGFGRRIDRPPR